MRWFALLLGWSCIVPTCIIIVRNAMDSSEFWTIQSSDIDGVSANERLQQLKVLELAPMQTAREKATKFSVQLETGDNDAKQTAREKAAKLSEQLVAGDNDAKQTAAANAQVESLNRELKASQALVKQLQIVADTRNESGCYHSIGKSMSSLHGSCNTRQKPLVIMAGQGKTGTMSMSIALTMLGLKTAHFDCVTTCKPPMHSGCPPPHIITNKKLGTQYRQFKRQIYQIQNRAQLEKIDVCQQLDGIDAVGDVPMNQVTPYLYHAYGPGTKVILTILKPTDWVKARLKWMKGKDAGPLGWLFSGIDHPYAPYEHSVYEMVKGSKGSLKSAALAYLAETALLRCLIRPEDLLVVDLKEELGNENGQPQRLWQRLNTFLNTSLHGIDVSAFPYVSYPFCEGKLKMKQGRAGGEISSQVDEWQISGKGPPGGIRDHPEQEIEARGIHPVLDRVHYINLAESKDRRSWMEKWLRASKIPYERVEAGKGPLMESPDKRRVAAKSAPKQCRGIIGLRDSNFYIMDHLNTSGSTLVLEDDYWVNLTLIPLLVAKVPADWDIIRFDCWGAKKTWGDVFQILRNEEGQVEIRSRGKTFFTEKNSRSQCNACREGQYYGGTHAMLWRRDAIPKLRAVWGVLPADDIDCRLATDQLRSRSYCVQGPGFPKLKTLTFQNNNFTTTIPKVNQKNQPTANQP